MNKTIRGSLCLLCGTIIWGSAFVAQSVGMDYIGPFTFQAVRCLLAVLGLLPIIFLADRKKQDGRSFWGRWADRKLWRAGILCAIPLFLASSLQQIGLIDTDAGKSAFLTAMYIVFVPIIGLLFRKKLSPMVPVSVGVAVLGLYLLSWTGAAGIQTGDLSLLGCAVAFAVQIAFIDRFAGEVDALRLNCIQALLCALASAVVMVFTETPAWKPIADCWLPLCYAGFLSMGLAYSLQILGQRNLDPTGAALIMSLESVFAALFGWLLLGETMTLRETMGSALVFFAVILSQVPIPQKKK